MYWKIVFFGSNLEASICTSFVATHPSIMNQYFVIKTDTSMPGDQHESIIKTILGGTSRMPTCPGVGWHCSNGNLVAHRHGRWSLNAVLKYPLHFFSPITVVRVVRRRGKGAAQVVVVGSVPPSAGVAALCVCAAPGTELTNLALNLDHTSVTPR